MTLVGPRENTNGALQPPGDDEAHLLDVIPLPAVQLGRSQFLLRGLLKTLRSTKPDIVCVDYDAWHVQFVQVALNLLAARSRARIILIVKKNTFRAPNSLLGRGKRLIARWGIRRTSAIIAASEITRDLYIRVLGARESSVYVQPHLPIDVSRFHPVEATAGQKELRVGFVGKIGTTKGVPELLAAFEQVRERSEVPIELWLAGRITDPVTQAAIMSADDVHHVGAINNDDLHLFMADIDLFVMPARVLPDHQEHDGRAVLEAMSSGVPCVVSDSGILPEIVSNGEGRVFPAGNTARLADCLQELIASPELRRALGRGARQRAVATVSPDVLSDARVAVFDETMEVRRERAKSR
ncbi:glycosyltransferase family 4 protein [Mycolicibacterium elephantis]|nr:glycosyltransferase family 4 protein [Mycolicibacterium elephantis]